MPVFRKIRRALFSWKTRFEIRPFALLPTISTFPNTSDVFWHFQGYRNEALTWNGPRPSWSFHIFSWHWNVGNMAKKQNLKTQVTRKQITPYFQKNKHLFTPWYAHVRGIKNISFMTNLTQIFLKIYFHKVTIGSCSKTVLMFYTNIFRGYNVICWYHYYVTCVRNYGRVQFVYSYNL